MAIKGNEEAKYIETKHLSLFITGKKEEENWNAKKDGMNFYTLKGIVSAVLQRLGITEVRLSELNNDAFSFGLGFNFNKKTIVEFGSISKSVLKLMDIKQEVFYADFNWDLILDAVKKTNVTYTEVPKFPEVRRDLALLIDKNIKFEQLEQLAFQAEKNILKSVNLFDIYQGDKLPADKKEPIETAFAELKTAHTAKDSAGVDAAMEKLNAAWTAASEEMYKATQGAPQGGPEASNAESAGGASNNAEATDVDFEEVKEDKK